MWYRFAFEKIYLSKEIIKCSMIKAASSIDELWNNLRATGVANKINITDKNTFHQMFREKEPQQIESLGKQIAENVTDEMKGTIQQAYANYASGKILAEEINKIRELAAAENREPSVAELRQARINTNQRLENEMFFPGLGMPSQIQTGRRGPLGKIKVTPQQFEEEVISENEIKGMAQSILKKEIENKKREVYQKYLNGDVDSPVLTTADIRAAILNTNEQLEEGIKYRIGRRGPLPKQPGLTRHIKNEQDYYEWKKRQEKKRNLELGDVINVEEGNIPIPVPNADTSDNYIPEEDMVEAREAGDFVQNLETIKKQANYTPLPPLHDNCRCNVMPVSGGYIWKTAGDDLVCDECLKHEALFNSLLKA